MKKIFAALTALTLVSATVALAAPANASTITFPGSQNQGGNQGANS